MIIEEENKLVLDNNTTLELKLKKNTDINTNINKTNDEIVFDKTTIVESFYTIFKAKWFILVNTLFIVLMAYSFINYINPYKAEIKSLISLNFKGIEKGLDPNGNIFDISIIKSPELLNKTLQKLELNKYKITVDDLRNTIDIRPFIPDQILKRIEILSKAKISEIKDNQDLAYYPNQYIISYKLLKSVNLTQEQAKMVINEIILQYQDYIYNKYNDSSALGTALGSLEYDEYDYPEVTKVISNQILIMQNYIKAKILKNKGIDFRSKKNSLSYADILSSLDVIKNINLNRLESLVGAYNLTKNREKLLKLYEYQIKRHELEKKQANDETKIISEIITKYQKSKSLVMMPNIMSNDKTNNMLELENKDNEYYNQLFETNIHASIKNTNLNHEINYIKEEINKLQNDTITIEDKKESEKIALTQIKALKDKLNNWMDIIKHNAKEEYDTGMLNTAISKITPAESYSTITNFKITILVSIIAGFFLSLAIIFSRKFWQSAKTEFYTKIEKYKAIIGLTTLKE